MAVVRTLYCISRVSVLNLSSSRRSYHRRCHWLHLLLAAVLVMHLLGRITLEVRDAGIRHRNSFALYVVVALSCIGQDSLRHLRVDCGDTNALHVCILLKHLIILSWIHASLLQGHRRLATDLFVA